MKLPVRMSVLLLVFTMVACDSDDPGIACTLEFVVLTIEVEDNQGQPVVFDSVAVNRKSDNFLYEFDIELGLEPGTYMLMTDKYFQDLDKNGTPVLFAGFNDPNSLQLVASFEYVVKQGLCHVEKVSGDDVIRLP